MSDWIKCSEKLPEPITSVIITYSYTDPITGEVIRKVGISAHSLRSGKWYDEEISRDCLTESDDPNRKVIAWMPFPEPYQGEP